MLHYFKYLTFIVLISCSSQRSLAQTEGSKKAQEIYAKANEDLVFGRYQEALSGFELAVKTDPSYINAHLQIANLYQNLYNLYDQAVGHYEAVIKLDKTLYKSYYEAGQCYLSMLDYVNAEKNTSLYLEMAELSANGKWQANLLMESIKFAKAAVMNPVVYEPKNLGPSINSEKAEYFPSITADNEWLYFTINDMSQKYPNEDIYAAQFIDGQWQKRIPVKGVNGFDSQEGAHSITQDGRYLFFASDRMEGNLGRFDLYIAKKVGDEWEKPMNMGNVVNTRHWESQPVISANSKQIFLVRKSNDGFGGSDIYVSNLGEEGKFGSPVNLGNVINTPGDEQRPYLHPDGKTLYFASNGHPGMGKTDVFKSILQADGAWSVPQNLGYPLNSVEMEYGLYVASDGKTAYIASDRAGGFGDMDIYSFIMPESARPALVLSVKGVVKDVTTLNGLKANIKIIEIESGEIYKTLSSDEINGSFLITLAAGKNYVYQSTAEGYLPYSENFSLTLQNPKEILQLVALMQRIEQGKEFTLKNIFFDTGEYQLLEESKAELNLLVDFIKKDERLFLEVGGHTDSDGAIENNLVLSEKRAKAVQDYLISQGVAQNRLTFKGYGEGAPLFPNDSEANKAKNRRTAFKVL
jgi:outer membrane protein OmpA-like peptidoglycan-associated protein